MRVRTWILFLGMHASAGVPFYIFVMGYSLPLAFFKVCASTEGPREVQAHPARLTKIEEQLLTGIAARCQKLLTGGRIR